jgi:hypothetical protein
MNGRSINVPNPLVMPIGTLGCVADLENIATPNTPTINGIPITTGSIIIPKNGSIPLPPPKIPEPTKAPAMEPPANNINAPGSTDAIMFNAVDKVPRRSVGSPG